IIGVNAREVDHLRLAWERGFGPIDLADIDISGDVSLDEAKERASGFEVGLIRVEKYFEGTNIRAYSGPPPSNGATDYCWGGCPGAIEEAIEILRVFDHGTDAKMPKIHVVFGAYDGPLNVEPGEKVVFIGDCAAFKGELHGKMVDVDSVYVDRANMNPHEAKHADVYLKMIELERVFRKHKNDDFIVLRGCPVSVAENVLALVKLGRLKNPIFDARESIPFTNAYLSWRTRTAIHRLFGK